MNTRNSKKNNEPAFTHEDADLVALDRVLTQAADMVFPPPSSLPEATDQEIDQLMKATESIRNPTSSISDDPELVLLDRLLTKSGGVVFPPPADLAAATDKQVQQLMEATKGIRNSKLQRHPLHFPIKRALALAAVFVILLGIGLHSLISAPAPSFTVVIDFPKSRDNETNLHSDSGKAPLTILASGVLLAATEKHTPHSGRGTAIVGAVIVATAAVWDSHIVPFFNKIEAKLPSKDQKLIRTSVLKALDESPKKAEFIYLGKGSVSGSRSYPIGAITPPIAPADTNVSVFTRDQNRQQNNAVSRFISKKQSKNIVYVTIDAGTGELNAMVFDSKTGKKLAETWIHTGDTAEIQAKVSSAIASWMRDGLL